MSEIPESVEAAQEELGQLTQWFQKVQADIVAAQDRHAFLRGFIAAQPAPADDD